ncbi:universal stress protein [Chamaesiphon sp.]|uniref:universal stress protein n=1 Tax=Chamaesiphon sp. TaxID=2814140 RepID=UPI0035939478
MFERVLICTDFKDGLQRLAHYTDALAAGGMKQIVFLHVVPLLETRTVPKSDNDRVEQAQARLTAAVGKSPAGVEIHIEVRSGQSVETILQVARSYGSESIVLGSQTHSSLVDLLRGSTMTELSRRTTIPLLILRPQLIAAFTGEELRLRCQHLFRAVLVPYDGSTAANFLVEQIKQLAQKQTDRFLERCVLSWVTGDIPTQTEQNLLADIKVDLEAANLQVTTDLRRGTPLTEILEVAQMEEISTIAISTGTIGKFQEWIMASFAAELLRMSWSPVLFFPPSR